MRSGSSRELRIALTDGSLVGTVDTARAPAVVHPGAMYLHQGRCFRVKSLDLDECVAIVEDGAQVLGFDGPEVDEVPRGGHAAAAFRTASQVSSSRSMAWRASS